MSKKNPISPKSNTDRFLIPATAIATAVLIVFVFLIGYQNSGLVLGVLGINTTPAPTSTFIQPTSSITPTPIVQSTTQSQTYVNSDPIIDCKSTYSKCYGETIKLHSSQCSNITCCGFNNGKWIVYPDLASCKADQAKDTIPPQGQNTTTQRSSTNNVWCWNNTYGYGYYTSSGDQCNLDNAKSTTNNICITTQKIKSNTCSTVCQTVEDQGKQACSGLSAYPVDYYGQCLNGPGGVSDQYGACLSKCSDQYAQDLQQCK